MIVYFDIANNSIIQPYQEPMETVKVFDIMGQSILEVLNLGEVWMILKESALDISVLLVSFAVAALE